MLPHEVDVQRLVHEEMPRRLVSRRRARTAPVALAGERPSLDGPDRELRAVLAFSRPAVHEGVVVSTVYGLAVRRDARRLGLARQGLLWLSDQLLEFARGAELDVALAGQPGPDVLILTGIVHRDNAPSRALLQQLGWEVEGAVAADGYQRCRLIRPLD